MVQWFPRVGPVQYEQMPGGVIDNSRTKVKQVHKELPNGGQSDGRRHGTAPHLATMTEVQTLWNSNDNQWSEMKE